MDFTYCRLRIEMKKVTEDIDDVDFARFMAHLAKEKMVGPLIQLYIDSKVMAEGPRVYRPTMQLCEEMSHVDPRLPLTEYRQTYDTLIVDYPHGERFDYTIIHSYPGANLLMLLHFHGGSHNQVIVCTDGSIHDFLEKHDADAEGSVYKYTRIAINLALYLVYRGCSAKPNWHKHKENHQLAKSKDPERRKLGRRHLECAFTDSGQRSHHLIPCPP